MDRMDEPLKVPSAEPQARDTERRDSEQTSTTSHIDQEFSSVDILARKDSAADHGFRASDAPNFAGPCSDMGDPQKTTVDRQSCQRPTRKTGPVRQKKKSKKADHQPAVIRDRDGPYDKGEAASIEEEKPREEPSRMGRFNFDHFKPFVPLRRPMVLQVPNTMAQLMIQTPQLMPQTVPPFLGHPIMTPAAILPAVPGPLSDSMAADMSGNTPRTSAHSVSAISEASSPAPEPTHPAPVLAPPAHVPAPPAPESVPQRSESVPLAKTLAEKAGHAQSVSPKATSECPPVRGLTEEGTSRNSTSDIGEMPGVGMPGLDTSAHNEGKAASAEIDQTKNTQGETARNEHLRKKIEKKSSRVELGNNTKQPNSRKDQPMGQTEDPRSGSEHRGSQSQPTKTVDEETETAARQPTDFDFPVLRPLKRLDRRLVEEEIRAKFMSMAMEPVRQAVVAEIDRRNHGLRRIYFSEPLPDVALPNSINFSKGIYPEGQRLTMPRETMPVDELFVHIGVLHVIMQREESIYQATGWEPPVETGHRDRGTAIYEFDYIAHARQKMSRDEIAAFEGYLAGKLPLPEWAEIEASTDRITRAPPQNLDEFGDLLRFLYGRTILIDDAKKFVRRRPRLIPLLFALQKVVSSGVSFADRSFATVVLAKEFRCRDEVRRVGSWALSEYQKSQDEIIKSKNALLDSVKEQVANAERTYRRR